ncbi:MAG: hypothetical protein CR991_03100 [Proteobacteria bacterium]|nr:MAG: hypothetical protein CR991_03100 [Pseudomonadota bacterium]
MPLLTQKDRIVFFIHIPKTGGSYIEETARQNGWDVQFIVNGINAKKLDFMPVSPQHFHAELYEKIFKLEKKIEIFTIVRHPFDRLKSEYYWQYKQGISYLKPDEWISFIFKEYHKNPSAYDNHIRLQTEFIPSFADCFIFKLENEGIVNALNYLGLNKQNNLIKKALGYIRAGNSDKLKVSNYLAEIEDIFAKRRDDIEQFYIADMNRFGYNISKKP